MIRRPPISTRTDTSFPTRRSSDLHSRLRVRLRWWAVTTIRHRAPMVRPPVARRRAVPRRVARLPVARLPARSEEHTSELQSLMRISYAVFCLKKKKHIECSRVQDQIKHDHKQKLKPHIQLQ